MLIHLRLTLPSDLTDPVVELVRRHEWSTNVTVQRGVCVEPEGDLVEADVARERVNEVLEELHRIGACERGGVVLTTPTGTPFAAAERLERAAPGDPDDAVIWESVLAEAQAGARPTLSATAFLILAVILAAIAVILDSSILVVGAMVVGPEFSMIGAASVGLVFGRWALVVRSLRLLVLGFAVAVVVVAALSLVGRATGAITVDMVTAPRPQTDFIWHPDMWSFIVALVAGAAGALALAIHKTSTMVGVFISVTTIPAAGNLALGLAFWQGGEIVGSSEQLLINIVGMVAAGALVLAFQRVFWTRLTALADRFVDRRQRD
ncbi:DUF389 domain-containing protein [Nocardioides cynanchi]|uniref:DUF389 domain-containing protein n=1 Tax=Nocardioides cynanchi TaxID=2558918 RepID=UPI001246BFD5|nr:DUF389 domain-containing protein [Nocardioides cynanchi]